MSGHRGGAKLNGKRGKGERLAGQKDSRADQRGAEGVVASWVDAFNDRDLDGVLAAFDPEIEFRPLRLPGVAHVYHGHEGVRLWFDVVTAAGHPHRIEVEAFKPAGSGGLVAAGSVRLGTSGSLSPFTGLYGLTDGLIADAVHYFTPPDVLERLGIIEAGAAP